MNEVELLHPEIRNSRVSEYNSQQTTYEEEGIAAPSGDDVVSEKQCELSEEQLECNVGPQDVNSSKKKRKHSRSKKRKWRPYYKLSWKERREVDKRAARRSNRDRENCSYGNACAPSNTTQFLIEDHNLEEPDYDARFNGRRHRGNSVDSSEEFCSSLDDEDDIFMKQFTETYVNEHLEYLSGMGKSELVQELMSLEDREEMLMKKLQAAKKDGQTTEGGDSEVPGPNFDEEQVVKLKLTVFREEIQKLIRENEILRHENKYLQTKLPVEDGYISQLDSFTH